MKTVILCNRLSRLRARLKKVSGPLRYINLVEDQESFRIRTYLCQRANTQELDRSQLFRERSEGFRQKYIEFMGRVNARNHSLHWWAMSFTDKNPLITSLCRNTFYFLLISELVRCDDRPLLVITNSTDLAAQVRVSATRERFKAVDLLNAPGRFKRLLKQYTPAGIIKASLRSSIIWALSRRHKPVPNMSDAQLVISTVTHPASFKTPEGYRDAYFGTLVEHVAASEHKALILAGIIERPFEQLKKLKTLKFGVPIVPLESCLPLGNLLTCTLQALWLYARPPRLRGPIEIDGLELSCLMTRAIKDSRHSGDFLLNLLMYYSARWWAQSMRVARCLYPYENRAWEKMLLLGMRSASSKTRLVGYQHASITLSHTNFILGREEAKITPLPDVILTTGPVISQRLEKEGNYPAGMFKTACALRQGQPVQTGIMKRPQHLTRVLTALSSSLEEYVNTLVLLERAFSGSNGYEVRIRPHPAIPLGSALEIAQLARFDFYSPSTGSLTEDLQWAHVVLYASSTVGLEAISLGIPAVYLDLGNFLDTDPMLGWDDFKWAVVDPGQLVETIGRIDALPESEFLDRQEKGREYVASYLSPITESALRMFIEA